MRAQRCPQPQCQSDDLNTRHAGYVRHRNQGEDACKESKKAHAEYVQRQRAERRASHAEYVQNL